MPVWVPELEMLYILVPRAGGAAMKQYLTARYNAVDLAAPAAVEAKLVAPGHGLVEQSDFDEVARQFRWPTPRRRVVQLGGVRNPADSLFSKWWRYAYTYPQLIGGINELPKSQRQLLRSEAVRRQLTDIGEKSFSDWVVSVCTAINDARAVPGSRADELRRALPGFVRAGLGPKSGTEPRVQDVWYSGATEYLPVEDLNAQWARMCRERGWSHRGPIAVVNKTPDRPADYAPHLTDEAATLLRRCFRRVIARFGYEIRSQSSD